MSNSSNDTHGRARNRVGPPRFRAWALAVLVPLAVAPVVGLSVTSPANADAQGAHSRDGSLSATGLSFTVNGKIPYKPDALSDGTTPANTSCSTIRRLKALVEAKLAEHTVFPSDAANLFQHWLDGTGTGVSLGQNSAVARELLTYPGFVNMNNKVQAFAAQRFDQGQTSVTLPTPTIPFLAPTASSPLTLLNFSNEHTFPSSVLGFSRYPRTGGLRVGHEEQQPVHRKVDLHDLRYVRVPRQRHHLYYGQCGNRHELLANPLRLAQIFSPSVVLRHLERNGTFQPARHLIIPDPKLVPPGANGAALGKGRQQRRLSQGWDLGS